MKKYFKVKENSGITENNIKITIDYELGGHNVFSGNVNRRGYYLYAQPVTLTENEYNGRSYTSESIVMFSGFKVLLKEVGRKSEKAYKEAVELARLQENRNIIVSKYGSCLEDKLEY
jgi:CDP-diacylglycerol pyrophosphatase